MAKVIRKNGKKPTIKKKVVMELLYMSPNKIGVKEFEQVYATFQEVEVHVWDQLGILELTMPSNNTVDMETMTDYIDDEEDIQFIKEQGVETVYAITLDQDSFEEYKPYIVKVIETYGGFLCTDSDDFTPIYSLEELQ